MGKGWVGGGSSKSLMHPLLFPFVLLFSFLVVFCCFVFKRGSFCLLFLWSTGHMLSTVVSWHVLTAVDFIVLGARTSHQYHHTLSILYTHTTHTQHTHKGTLHTQITHRSTIASAHNHIHVHPQHIHPHPHTPTHTHTHIDKPRIGMQSVVGFHPHDEINHD